MLWARQMGSSGQVRFSVVRRAAVIANRVTVVPPQSFCIRASASSSPSQKKASFASAAVSLLPSLVAVPVSVL